MIRMSTPLQFQIVLVLYICLAVQLNTGCFQHDPPVLLPAGSVIVVCPALCVGVLLSSVASIMVRIMAFTAPTATCVTVF